MTKDSVRETWPSTVVSGRVQGLKGYRLLSSGSIVLGNKNWRVGDHVRVTVERIPANKERSN